MAGAYFLKQKTIAIVYILYIVNMITDGLSEATNSSDELYGEERALTSLNQHKGETLQDLLKSLQKNVDLFVSEAPQFDDLTMMVLKCYGSEN